MTCDLCKQASATQAITQQKNDKKTIQYRCDACLNLETQPPPKLNRPCNQCKQHEGHIKFVRQRPQGRVVTYLCDVCVGNK